MRRKPMTWKACGVARSKRGKLLLVLEVGDGSNADPPTDKQKALLERKGLWVGGMTRSQAWWIGRWSFGRVKVAPDQTRAEVAALRKKKKKNPPLESGDRLELETSKHRDIEKNQGSPAPG